MTMPPVTTHGTKLDVALWFPSKQIEYTNVPHRQAHERPCEGVITSSKLNKHAISVIEGRGTHVHKFGSSGRVGGTPPRCLERTVARGDVESDSDVDDWQGRKGAAKLRKQIKVVANSHSPPNRNLPLTRLVPESPGGWSREEDSGLDRSTCANWGGQRALGHQINWEDEISKA